MTEDRKILLAALEELRKKGPISVHAGICYNVQEIAGDDYLAEIMAIALGWGHHSGNCAYPIPSTIDGQSSPVFCYDSSELWQGEQLDLRHSLIDYLIAKIKNEEA